MGKDGNPRGQMILKWRPLSSNQRASPQTARVQVEQEPFSPALFREGRDVSGRSGKALSLAS
jgi:hypothetical protein